MASKSSIWIKVGIGAVVLIVILTIAKMKGCLGATDETKVTVEVIAKHDIIEIVSANGKVQPEVELKMSADVSGEIVELYVKEGDVVKKGTLLCKINPEIYISSMDRANAAVNAARSSSESSKSRLEQAKSQFKQSELNYNRNKKLFDESVISSADFETAKSNYEVAKAEVDAATQSVSGAIFNINSSQASLKEANENLNKTNIYAPVDGTVSKLSKEKGERVVGTNMMEGTEILRLANLNEMEVSVDVSENDIVRVSLGDTADVEIDAYIGKKFKGIVTEVANSANSSASSSITDQVTNFTVKVRILRESYQDLLSGKSLTYSPFRPGMSASVEIRTRREYNVLAIPIQSVTTRDTTVKLTKSSKKAEEIETTTVSIEDQKKLVECVFVVEEGKAKLRAVKTGIQDNSNIQILEGLKEGEKVVSGPYNAIARLLKDGDVLMIVTKDELFEADKKSK
jgi:HlyD family secretion protein